MTKRLSHTTTTQTPHTVHMQADPPIRQPGTLLISNLSHDSSPFLGMSSEERKASTNSATAATIVEM